MTQLLNQVKPNSSSVEESLYRLSIEQYHSMIQGGILTSDDRVELIEGVLVARMPTKPPHVYVIEAVEELLLGIIPTGWRVRTQKPITLEDSEPEPDLAIAKGDRRTYMTNHPRAIDLAIVIEVSDSTLDRDRSMKQRIYARAGIAEYWIVNINERQVEVYTQPDLTGVEPTYRKQRIFSTADSVPVLLDGKRMGEISVRSILP